MSLRIRTRHDWVRLGGDPRAWPGTPTPATRRQTPARDRLWAAVQARWPHAVCEYKPLPTRRFRIDIAFPDALLAIEIDGWTHHGRFKKDFQRDRTRQNALTLQGWRVLRFFNKEIVDDLPQVLAHITQALEQPRLDPRHESVV